MNYIKAKAKSGTTGVLLNDDIAEWISHIVKPSSWQTGSTSSICIGSGNNNTAPKNWGFKYFSCYTSMASNTLLTPFLFTSLTFWWSCWLSCEACTSWQWYTPSQGMTWRECCRGRSSYSAFGKLCCSSLPVGLNAYAPRTETLL